MPSTDLGTVARVSDALFAPGAPHGISLALVVMRAGDMVYERYGEQPTTVFGPAAPVTADTTLVSWSMAKSITHAAVGMLVGEGRLSVDQPAPVATWQATPKAAITLQHLLNMRDGLEWVEDYVDNSASHCLQMLFGEGSGDVAAYAAARPAAHAPGEVWNYSSGTSNIVARIVGDAVGGGRAGMESFLGERLFGPAGMHSASVRFDDAGTFIGSSFVHATAHDFARFGELYRNDGVAADGTRVLPSGWRDHGRERTAVDPESGFGYGAHWWLWPEFPGSFAAHGYEGQYTLVVPDRQLVVVHLGKVAAELRPMLDARLREIVESAGSGA